MTDNDDLVSLAYNNFILQLHSILINTMPVDTRNMLNSTRITMSDDLCEIVITGVNDKGYDYAYDVNYNDQHTPKLYRNYHYVERAIQNAGNIVISNLGGLMDDIY